MEITNLIPHIESLIFASDKPLTTLEILELVNNAFGFMAAEMSTGALCLAHLYKRNPPVSMLVVKVESEYFKKATGKTTFICEDGSSIKEAIEQAVESGEAKIARARSVGRNSEGVIVAEFFVTWSFKAKR